MAAPVSGFVYKRPSITINAEDATCYFRKFNVEPDQEFVDDSGYCSGPNAEIPGGVTWLSTGEVRMSYNVATDVGAWEFFHALSGQAVEFVVTPGPDPVSAENPSATFTAWVPQIAFMPDHDPGSTTTYELEFRIVGEPVFDTGGL